MVLDALIKIKNEIDPTLTFRRSCREGKRQVRNLCIITQQWKQKQIMQSDLFACVFLQVSVAHVPWT